jgi:hypothetical protein
MSTAREQQLPKGFLMQPQALKRDVGTIFLVRCFLKQCYVYVHTYIVTIWGCVTIDGVWISEFIYTTWNFKLITALSLISTTNRSPQHPLRLFQACYVFISRSLATTSNSGVSSAFHAQILCSQPPVQNPCELSTQVQRHLFSASLEKLN